MTVTADAATTTPCRLPWLADLAARGSTPAIVTPDVIVTYADLAARVAAVAAGLVGTRRLVLVEGANRLDSLVGYLGALLGGHVVLLVPSGSEPARETMRAAYDPDVVVAADGSVTLLREGSGHDLHPDLALLLSTSGSTGSPKLVRLSWENLSANADQIATYLNIRESDCAATTLPLHYCYGLSVVHSHLSRGASIALTDLSVVDECFWTLFREAGATTLAGVPYTFELLERVGFASMDLPRLRYVTQAGGRLEPERVRHWASVGQARGWDLFVMYGQTEGTARMAYLPPARALEHPASIGVPVPGGAFDIVDGELVYSGPNVMLGYAETPADLALGRTVDRLRTGDLGHLTEAGLYELTGRRSRFTKVLGHRIDLDRVEASLRATGHDARCAGREGLLAVAVCDPAGRGVDHGAVRRLASRLSGAPTSAIQVVGVGEHPRLASGKTDHAAILRLVDELKDVGHEAERGRAGNVAQIYAAALGRADVDASSTFVALGGDSLSYVEVSIRLEGLLGTLPTSWHLTPVAQLQEMAGLRAQAPRGAGVAGESSPRAESAKAVLRRRTIETNVWLRALAIVLIVGTHADLFSLQGTAHALLVLVGFNVVRFALASEATRGRVRSLGRGAARVVLPTLAVIVPAHVIWGYYEPRNVVLANWLLGEERLGPPWRFWFIEALVLALVVTMALVAVPAFARAEKRWPFALPLVLTAVAFTLRLDLYPLPGPRMQGSALVVLFLFFLGWSIARAGTRRQQWIVTVVAVGAVGTFSGNPARDLLSLAFVLLLIWKPVSRVPAALVPVVHVLAASSLYIYVIHWQVLEHLWGSPVPAFVASLAVGVAYWWMWSKGVPAALRALSAAGRWDLQAAARASR
ncbi:MAG TPA: AMP-binding protein [Intrasporangium sp.]|uniref:AMP-binding protein n=1 Tax=Intrasporangium sp. TaxID=1925024 RepID=UPI002F92715E